MSSLIASLALQPEATRQRVLASLTDAQAHELLYEWRKWARPQQIAPDGDWQTWLVLAGRGFGETRTGAEWVREEVRAGSGLFSGFVAKFMGTSEGGSVGVISLEAMGSPFNYRLLIEDIQKVA